MQLVCCSIPAVDGVSPDDWERLAVGQSRVDVR